MNPYNIENFYVESSSHLLSVTKFLAEILNFNTEKNIFDYELFLPLNISDFTFFIEELEASEKILPSSYFLKIW